MSKLSKKPVSLILGAAVALAGMSASASASSVFQATDLGSGYMVAAAGDGKENKDMKKMSAAEMFDNMDTNSDGKVTKAEFEKNHKAVMEGKCGEGKCGEKKK